MKILLVQCSFLGDMILSTPVISAIQRLHPGADLSLMTTPLAAPLMRLDPAVSEIIVFDKRGSEKGGAGILKKAAELRGKRFDRVYSLHRSFRTALVLFLSGIPERIGFADSSLPFLYTRTVERPESGHAVLRNLSLVSDPPPGAGDAVPPMKLNVPGISEVSSLIRTELSRSGRYAVLAPGSAWKTKQWHWQGFARLSALLDVVGIRVYLVGGPGDKEICGKIAADGFSRDLSGQLALPETLLLMNHAGLVVCNDSMALHMASALKRPTVAVFCSTTSDFGFGPWDNPEARVVEDTGLACRPCGRHGHMACPNGTEACMSLDARTVMAVCIELLGLPDDLHANA